MWSSDKVKRKLQKFYVWIDNPYCIDFNFCPTIEVPIQMKVFAVKPDIVLQFVGLFVIQICQNTLGVGGQSCKTQKSATS